MVLTHVERVLLNYCQPGMHEYGTDPASADSEQCRACGRRQRLDGTTCMLCESAGVGRYVLSNSDDTVLVDGPLCNACLRELNFRGEVRGWALSQVAAA